MTVENFPGGKPVVILGTDGTDLYGITTDADGHLQVDVLSTALPTGAATEATLATLATETKLEAVRVLLASVDEKDFSTQTTLAALLTELQAKADLSETQPISAASLPLPSGAATETTLDEIMDRLGDESSPATGSVNKQLTELKDRIGSRTNPLPGSTNRILAVISGRIGSESDPLTGSTNSLLTGIETAVKIIDGFAHQDNTIFGYNDRWVQNLEHTMTEDAHYSMPFTAVGSGEVWVLQGAAGRDNARALKITVETITAGGLRCTHQFQTSGGAWQWVFFSGEVVLKEGDYVRIFFAEAITNDVLCGQVWGYKMKV